MLSILENLNDISLRTVLLYCFVIFAAVFFALLSQSKLSESKFSKRKQAALQNGSTDILFERNFHRIPYLISFCILAFFSAFTASGTDRTTYGLMFEEISFSNIGNGQEVLFNLFMLAIRFFTSEPAVFCAILAIVTLILLYYGIYKLREHMSVAMAVFIYCSLYYIQSFSLMRIFFASAILFAGFHLLLERKTFKYLLLVLLSFFIHYSTVIVFFVILVYYIMNRKDTAPGKKIAAAIFLNLIFVIGLLWILPNLGFLNIGIINRYRKYIENIHITLPGLSFYLSIVPLVLSIVYCWRYKKWDDLRWTSSISFFMVFVTSMLLSYSIPVFGRIVSILNIPYMFFIPFVYETVRERKYSIKNGKLLLREGAKSAQTFTVLWIFLFFVLQFAIYLLSYYALDGVGNYSFVWENYLW